MLPVGAVIAASLTLAWILGAAWLKICRIEHDRYLAAGLGLAWMMTLSLAGTISPAGSAGGLLAISIASGTAAAILLSSRPSLRGIAAGWDIPATAISAGAVATIPFLANGRFGILGVGFNNDLAAHLVWTFKLGQGESAQATAGGLLYPLGPHSLAGVFSRIPQFGDVEQVFIGLMMAAQIHLALVALSLLRTVSGPLRVASAAMASSTYLIAAFYAQGAFKEPYAALWLAMTVAIVSSPIVRRSGSSVRTALCLSPVQVAMFFTLGISGLAWTLGFLSVYMAAKLSFKSNIGAALRRAGWKKILVIAIPVGGLAALAWPIVHGQLAVLRTLGDVQGGNIPSYLSTYQVLGIWLSYDFRLPPGDLIRAGSLGALALVLAVWSAYWWQMKRDSALLIAVGISMVLYVASRLVYQPYFVAKVLVVPAPLIMVLILRASFEGASLRAIRARDRWGISQLRIAAGVGFLALAAISTSMVLRNASVGSMEKTAELAPIRAITKNQDTLYLGQDAFINLKLRDTKTSTFLAYSLANPIPLAAEPSRIPAYGHIVDFESIDEETLDKFTYAVTTSSAYLSTPPENWNLLKSTRNYRLYKRTGKTTKRNPVGSPTTIGALWDCSNTPSNAIVLVRQEPKIFPASNWSRADGTKPTISGTTVIAPPLERLYQELPLPDGEWDLSLQYSSPVRIRIESNGTLLRVLPADPDTMGEHWRVGSVSISKTPLKLSLQPESRALPTPPRAAMLGNLVATPVDKKPFRTQSSKACGKFVDWSSSATP